MASRVDKDACLGIVVGGVQGDGAEHGPVDPDPVGVEGDGVVGEATSINGKVIHLVGMKVDKNVKSDIRQGMRTSSDIFRSIGGPRLGSYRSAGGNPRTML